MGAHAEVNVLAVASTLVGSDRITADPYDMLAHYALGDIPCYVAGEGSDVAWIRQSHRGVHLLEEITIPKSQRRYVMSPRFEFHINRAFGEVVAGCADTSRTGFTWIGPELVETYTKLHEMGFAHSFEAWCDGELAGGCFGVQIGSYMSVESMFHRASHASKAAYGRGLMLLKERGFLLVDSNPCDDSSRNYGEEWVAQWRFEELLREAIERPASLWPNQDPLPLPPKVKRILPLARVVRSLARKVRGG